MEKEKLEEMLASVWDSLTDEQKAKAKECKNADEILAFAGSEGIELPDEALEAVAGGYVGYKDDTWHVLSDKTWETIESGFSTMEEAQVRATELGVKTDRVLFVEPLVLEEEPEPEKKKSGCG